MARPEVRLFGIEVPEEELVDLRRRILATRWPERETVADDSQGVQLATIRNSPAELGRAGLPQPDLFHEVDKGGHFAAWEEPELFCVKLRAAFQSLRQPERGGRASVPTWRREHPRPSISRRPRHPFKFGRDGAALPARNAGPTLLFGGRCARRALARFRTLTRMTPPT